MNSAGASSGRGQRSDRRGPRTRSASAASLSCAGSAAAVTGPPPARPPVARNGSSSSSIACGRSRNGSWPVPATTWQPGLRQQRRQLARAALRRERVLGAGDDERRRRHAVEALLRRRGAAPERTSCSAVHPERRATRHRARVRRARSRRRRGRRSSSPRRASSTRRRAGRPRSRWRCSHRPQPAAEHGPQGAVGARPAARQDERPHALGLLDREPLRNSAAERGAHDVRALGASLIKRRERLPRALLDRAAARRVVDHALLARERRDLAGPRGGGIGEPTEQQQILPVAGELEPWS